MDISSVPGKCIELTALPIKDGKVRRLFILADGKRTVSEIIRQAMVAENEGLEGIQQLLTHNFLAIGESGSEAGKHTPAAFLRRVTEELAEFVGPFAAVAMEPYASLLQNDSDSARQEVIEAALAEIDSNEDRQELLSTLKPQDLSVDTK
ncbi:hypothetical protein [Desulfosediminicola ganghwensis]|uniref:hypothetical protein n=1 Tax=Desulfosediminicola ganghwensis TaxID=2569540 RepID=UPI0010AD4F9F|nr:hypothetical protein [Desulfosediminicola ganghwensis]